MYPSVENGFGQSIVGTGTEMRFIWLEEVVESFGSI